MSTPLTDRITALKVSANAVTGASDTTLTDAVGRLIDGYKDVAVEMAKGEEQFLKEEIVLPDSVTKIGNYAFYNRYPRKITGVEVTEIGYRAFSANGGAQTVVFAYDFPNLDKVSGYTFERRDFGGRPAVLTARDIGNDTFDTCKNLPSIKYTRADSIGIDQVYNCASVTTIIINSTPSWIHARAFRSASALTDIYVPWVEGAVANAPWSATNATIHYNTTFDENGDPVT